MMKVPLPMYSAAYRFALAMTSSVPEKNHSWAPSYRERTSQALAWKQNSFATRSADAEDSSGDLGLARATVTATLIAEDPAGSVEAKNRNYIRAALQEEIGHANLLRSLLSISAPAADSIQHLPVPERNAR